MKYPTNNITIASNKSIMNKKITTTFVLLISFFTLLLPNKVAAASSYWSSNIGYLEAFTYNPEYCYSNCNGDVDNYNTTGKWLHASRVDGMSASVSHTAAVRNNTTGITSDTPVVQVGNSISFLPTANSGTDIAWNVTGFNTDTPYGNWSNSTSVTCDASTYAGENTAGSGFYTAHYYGYIALNVIPTTPTIVKSGTAGLNCSDAFNCTVTSAGTINATITWPATSGYFNSRYTKTGVLDPPSANTLETGTCISSTRMKVLPGSCNLTWSDPGSNSCAQTSPDYVLTVPAQSIAFALTATAAPSVEVHFSFLNKIKSFVSSLITSSHKVFAGTESKFQSRSSAIADR